MTASLFRLGLLLSLGGLTACATSSVLLSPKGQEVVVVGNRTQLPGCSLRSEVRALGLVGTANSRHQALIKARNQAAEAGATHLQLEHAESNRVSTTLVGKALFCVEDIALEDQDFNLDNLYILD
ncbi:MAG: hypothetical protein CL923_06805 [Deltaproteobacteria bacterium]|jgi:hypothetical protein|nr:hypothetical protein [Deltaproteobacteria bacterium]MBQ32250.1 hypothetical protein [Deltaproteobacteria bacterium]MDP7156974.1 hypothetical protein [SAR324 cluster bacterium]MDP7318525.1 hypothetical protein [SAR324 cluster bacterium]MDP7629971.1 hypothetical protein [SAR324 cluster bacterium]